MKAKKLDQYDFNLSSPSGQPGFEVFEDKKNKCWRFHGNDVQGQAVLFSQPYGTADSAQRGMKTVIRLLKKKRGKAVEISDGWQIIIQSGNHQELARSRMFEQNESATKILQYFQNVANSPKPGISEKVNDTTEKSTPRSEGPKSDSRIRHAFRLYFYPSKSGNNLTGRIENINAPRETVSFQDIDGSVILDFLRKQVKIAEPKIEKEKTGETTSDSPINTFAARITPGPSPSSIIDRQSGNRIELILKTQEDLPDIDSGIIENSKVVLRQMDSSQVYNLDNIPASFQENGTIRLLIDGSGLNSGTYHLNAEVWVKTTATDGSNTQYCIRGTGWVQLI